MGQLLLQIRVDITNWSNFCYKSGQICQIRTILANQGETKLYPRLPLTDLSTHLRSVEALSDRVGNIK